MRHNSSLALLDIPDLPIDAFRHVGDRKIKPQGVVKLAKDTLESGGRVIGETADRTLKSIGDVAKPVVKAIDDFAVATDKFVNNEIPGGWVTVAAVAGGAAYASSAAGAGAGTSGVIGASPVVTGYAGTTPVTMANAGGLLSGTGGAVGNAGLLTGATSLAGGGASPAAAALSSQVASSGLIPSVVQSVADFTGLSPNIIGQLGVTGVQSLISGYSASQIADQQKQASQTAADAQIRAAQIAADAARFRPVGVTTRFGQSNFQTDAAGNVIGAGYTPSPEILGYQNRLSTLANRGLTGAEQASTDYAPLTGAAQNLFSLGGSYIKKSPEEVAADYISKQQALIAPSRELQLSNIRNIQQQQGRGGLSVAQGGNLMATNPELAAYYNSIAQSDLVLAAQADQEAQNRIRFGAGLFDTGAGLQGKYYAGQTAAYSPFTTAMDVTSGLESLAQTPLTLGTQIGARTTASTAQAGNLLSQGITGAAQTMYPSNAFSPSGSVLAGLSQSPVVTGALNNLFGVQPQQQTFTTQQVMNLLSGRGFTA